MPDALGLLKALRRRWLPALALGLLCGGLAAAAAWFVVPAAKYEARAILSVSQTEPRIIFKTEEVRADFDIYKQTQLALIKSPIVLNEALKNREVRNLPQVTGRIDPVAWLEKEIEARYSGETLSISMRGDRPAGLEEFVNAVAKAYLAAVVDKEQKERKNRHEILKKIYDQYQAGLLAQKDLIREKAALIGTSDRESALKTYELSKESQVLSERQLRELRGQILEAEAELEVLRETQQAEEPGVVAMVPNSLIEQEIAKDRHVQDLQQEIARLEGAARQAYRVAAKPDPAYTRPQSELVKLRGDLAARREQLRAWYAEQFRQRGPAGPRQDLVGLEQRIKILKKLEKSVQAEVDELSKLTSDITTGTVDLSDLQAKLDLMETTAQTVGKEVEVLKVELEAPSRVAIIQAARTPQLGSDKRKIMTAGAGLGTLGLCLVGIAFLEFRSRRVGTLDEVVHGLGLNLVGALPALPVRSRRLRDGLPARRDLEWSNLLADSIDAIRARLLHEARSESLQVVMVTSATSGEGKTSLACHLATSLARAGRRTLLIDGDMRRPAVHRVFDLPVAPGLSELLCGEVELDGVFQPASTEGISVITAGHVTDDAVRAFTQEDLRGLFDQLRTQFDFVLIDTPPILPVSDALLLGQHVDAAICSILRDVSRLPQVYASHERLLSFGIRILGVVVAGMQGDAYGNTYVYAYTNQAKV